MNVMNDFLNRQRLTGDEEADALVSATFEANKQGVLYDLLKSKETEIEFEPDSDLKRFLITQKSQPAWLNQKRLQKGQEVFQRHAQEMMALLGAMSLPYCYAASPGNKALYLSDKMRNSPGKRLMDTASFVIGVLTPGRLAAGGKGIIYLNKVRLIHAVSRFHLKKQSAWNMEWGTPINQEDMAGTNLAFSYIILQGMQKSGYRLSSQEEEDFLHTWRYIGYQMNIEEQLLPASYQEAYQLTQLIKQRNFRKTEEGIALTQELLSFYRANAPSWQESLVTSQIRWYLGDEVADYIGLSKDPLRDRLTDSMSTFKSLQNCFSIQADSYQQMIAQHSLFKKKVSE
jgi:hypothetical protein